jgi:pimeloyl-ACP methyl ester carboxylesterase
MAINVRYIRVWRRLLVRIPCHCLISLVPMLSPNAPGVILLHGLGRTARSMRPVERALTNRGYRVLNVGYASRTAPIAELAAQVARRVGAWSAPAPIDFVTHSLGGILLRVGIASGMLPLDRVRRVVMLGPPNGGSELADTLPALPLVGALYRRFTGPAGLELGTTPTGVPAGLPPVAFELGVIAGNRSMNPFFSAILGAPNDGKVRVDRARVDGMRDFIVVPSWHPLLMVSAVVAEQTLHFLEHGTFRHSPSAR